MSFAFATHVISVHPPIRISRGTAHHGVRSLWGTFSNLRVLLERFKIHVFKTYKIEIYYEVAGGVPSTLIEAFISWGPWEKLLVPCRILYPCNYKPNSWRLAVEKHKAVWHCHVAQHYIFFPFFSPFLHFPDKPFRKKQRHLQFRLTARHSNTTKLSAGMPTSPMIKSYLISTQFAVTDNGFFFTYTAEADGAWHSGVKHM